MRWIFEELHLEMSFELTLNSSRCELTKEENKLLLNKLGKSKTAKLREQLKQKELPISLERSGYLYKPFENKLHLPAGE